MPAIGGAAPLLKTKEDVGWVERQRYPSAMVDGYRSRSTHPTNPN
jgi:hypothetical protein